MRRLWECADWSKYVDPNCRKGIRLRFEKGVDPEVRRACIQFVYWLKEQYEFPIRVPIYFKSSKVVKCMDGDTASATFFGPFDKSEEPYIRIAVGDYVDLLNERGKDNALAAILHSIAHELSHYFQWIKDSGGCDSALERQALYYSREIVYDYAEVVEHP